jgi:hypothetical protein
VSDRGKAKRGKDNDRELIISKYLASVFAGGKEKL